MAKTTVYVISRENEVKLARTLANVAEVIGERVSKKDIEGDKVTGVTVQDIELTEEQELELNDTGIVEMTNEDVWNSGITIAEAMYFEDEDELEEEIEMEDVKEVVEEIQEDVEELQEIAVDTQEVLETEQDIDEESVRELEVEEEYEDGTPVVDAEDMEEEGSDIKEVPEEVVEENKELNEETNNPQVPETKEETATLDTLLDKLKANNEKIAKENPEKAKKAKKTVTLKTDEDGEVVYPEVGYFKEEDEIKKYYKQLTNEQLDEWLELEGLEYTPNEHAGIDRMRKCVAIKDHHFPKETTAKKKSKSKYADLTTEDLLEMALENDIEVKDAKGNLRILRMYAIMALRDAGLIE